MSLLIETFGHQSNTSGLKTTQYEYVYDTVNTCHLVVRCDATLNGPVDITGDVTIDGNLDVTGTITGTVLTNPDYRVSYNTTSFAIPSTVATTYEVYQVNTTGGSITVTLPTISTLDALKKRSLFIVDVGGALSINPLTVVTSGGDTVAGDSSVEVSVDYTGLHVLSNANVAPGAAGKWLLT
jgi:hypothetical protein